MQWAKEADAKANATRVEQYARAASEIVGIHTEQDDKKSNNVRSAKKKDEDPTYLATVSTPVTIPFDPT
jgi:hypothetical protein